jgi:hypothetical protein
MSSILLLFGACLSYATTLTSISENTDTIAQYEKYEATFTLSRIYSNPFDTAEVEINATLTCPDLSVLQVPAFYYRLYQVSGSNPETYSNPGPEQWKFRFAPKQTGTYSYTITVIDIDGTQTVYSGGDFTCVPGSGRGFIRINPQDNLTFVYDDGSPRINIGHNVAWANNGWAGATAYTHYFSQMGAVGENWVRIWMNPWTGDGGTILEWRNHSYFGGVGRLSMQTAQRLDTIVEQARQNGIAIQLTFQYHGQFSTRTNPNWDENPYNIVNSADGGFLTNPEEFFTNAQARKRTKDKYRYIVARWGYSPAIFAWELWNEVQYTGSDARNWWTPGYIDEVVAWHDEMATYIKNIDPHHHPVTTSDYYQLSTPLYELDSIDIVQEHFYESPTIDVAQKMIRPLMERFQKPVIAGEFGNVTDIPEQDRLLIRNGSWAGLLNGQSAHAWWWDRIDPWNWYEDFAPISIFAECENLAGLNKMRRAVPGNESILADPLMEGFNDIPAEGLHCYQTDDRFTGMAWLSIYLHASWSPRKSNPYFHVEMPENGQFIIHVAKVSATAGSKLQITLDGASVYNQSQPSGGENYQISVPVTAGSHIVRVINTGSDWIEIRKYEFRPNTVSYVDSLGLIGSRKALLWIYDTNSQEQQTYNGWISGQTLTVRGLNDGWYNLDYFLTRAPGGPAFGTSALSGGGILTSPLPAFERDVALKITEVMDFENLVTMAAQWLQSGPDLESDFSGNNRVDGDDFAILSGSWLLFHNYLNPPIVVSAGQDQTLILEGGSTDPIQLDPFVNAIGDLTYAWSLMYNGPASPAPTINQVCSDPAGVNPFFTFPQAGTYTLTLTVRDILMQSDNGSVQIDVLQYPTRFQAEDADLYQLVGGSSGVYNDLLADNGKYCLIDWTDTPRIIWHITAPAAGTYHLYVRSQGVCCYDNRGDYYKVNNGSNKFYAFGNTPDGQWTTFGPFTITLNAGDNTIQIIRSWGGVRYDYIEIPDL